jgi:hypothetical protein
MTWFDKETSDMKMVSDMVSDLRRYKRWLQELTWEKVWFGTVTFAVCCLLVCVIWLPLRAYAIVTRAVVTKPPNIEGSMGAEFDFPMAKSVIEFLNDTPDTGIDIAAPLHLGAFFRPWGTLRIREGSKVLIPYSDAPLHLKIRYERGVFNAAGDGVWRGNSAFLRVQGALEGEFQGEPGHPDKKWGRLGSVGNSTRTVTPYFRVAVPFNEVNPAGEITDRIVRLQAVLNVSFPGMSGVGTYKDYTGDRTGNLECLVLSPGETRTYQEAHRAYFRSVATKTLLSHGGIFLVLAIISGVGFWRIRRERIAYKKKA